MALAASKPAAKKTPAAVADAVAALYAVGTSKRGRTLTAQTRQIMAAERSRVAAELDREAAGARPDVAKGLRRAAQLARQMADPPPPASED